MTTPATAREGAPRPDVLAAPRPQAEAADAAALARDLYGLAAAARPLASERDANFHLVTDRGDAFLLKVVNAAEDPAVSDMQTRALLHIAAADPALPVPRPCPARDGRFETRARLGGTDHIVRLLTYLQGQPLHLSPPSPAQAAALGRTLAALEEALADFHHPAAGHDLLWDLQRAPKLRPLLPCITDEGRRALATAALDSYEDDIRPRLSAFRRQVVHNDFNPHNVLVDPADPTRVTGVLDFGDMVETAVINDVAIAAAYQVGGDDPLERPLALVAAVHAARPLAPVEVDALFDLVSLRHVLSVTITAWRATLDPGNASYIMRNYARAAAGLESLARIGRAAATRRFRQACRMDMR